MSVAERMGRIRTTTTTMAEKRTNSEVEALQHHVILERTSTANKEMELCSMAHNVCWIGMIAQFWVWVIIVRKSKYSLLVQQPWCKEQRRDRCVRAEWDISWITLAGIKKYKKKVLIGIQGAKHIWPQKSIHQKKL